MERIARTAAALAGYLPGAIALLALISTRLYSHALYHTLAELFAIAVQFALFTVVWHSRRHLNDGALVVIGASAGPIAVIGLLHLLTYEPIGLVAGVPDGVSARLWLAARSLQAAALLAASWFTHVRPATWKVLAVGTAVTGLVIGPVVTQLPQLDMESSGITSPPLAIHAAVALVLVWAFHRFLGRTDASAPSVGRMLLLAIGCAAATEILLALSADPHAPSDTAGHIVRLAAAYALYRAVVVSVLEQPQATLFREISLRNARLEEADRALRRAKERSDVMLAVSGMIARAEPLDAVIGRALELGARAMGADGVILAAKRVAGWVVTHTHGFDHTVIGLRYEGPSARHLLLAQEKRSPVIVNDPALDPRVDQGFVSRFGVTSLLVAPLVARNEVLGALTFVKRRGRAGFTEQDRGFSARLATSLGLAVSNERMQTAQSRVVEALRSAILTMPDSLPGVRLGHVYRSADRIARIGGDFYDAFTIAEGRHAILMGDVSGKGIDAAVSSFVTRTAFHALALREQSPGLVMAAANDVLSRLLPDEAFATAIYGVIDVRDGVFTATSAGHPDPVVCSAHGCVEHDAVRNLPLGMFPGETYEEFRLPLADGDILVVFSDGVLDARRGQEPFGEQRMREVLDSAAAADPQTIAEILLDAVTSHADGTHVDDIAIVALKLERAPD